MGKLGTLVAGLVAPRRQSHRQTEGKGGVWAWAWVGLGLGLGARRAHRFSCEEVRQERFLTTRVDDHKSWRKDNGEGGERVMEKQRPRPVACETYLLEAKVCSCPEVGRVWFKMR